jgi:hypothetical protein
MLTHPGKIVAFGDTPKNVLLIPPAIAAQSGQDIGKTDKCPPVEGENPCHPRRPHEKLVEIAVES